MEGWKIGRLEGWIGLKVGLRTMDDWRRETDGGVLKESRRS
jgi:hypothetical protein